jgi:hypothetical protein
VSKRASTQEMTDRRARGKSTQVSVSKLMILVVTILTSNSDTTLIKTFPEESGCLGLTLHVDISAHETEGKHVGAGGEIKR